MAWIQPNSTIHLLQNVPLTNAYIHTTDYSNESAQFADFYSYKIASFTEYTYIRNNTIKIQGQIANLYAVNYMLFKNTAYENKWFYAFVTSVNYLNDNTVIIAYEIDVMQTWQFQYKIEPSYVEREIVAHDTLFGSLTEEELEVGEYLLKDYQRPGTFNSDSLVAIVGVSRKISDSTDDFEIAANLLYGMPTYETYYKFQSLTELQRFYTFYQNNGNTDDLLEMVLYPAAFIHNDDWAQDHQGFNYLKSLTNNNEPLSPPYTSIYTDKAVKGTTTFQSYVPKNAKMYNSPYFKYVISDLEGNSAEYSPEYFYTDLNPTVTDPAMQLTSKIYFLIAMPVNSIPQPYVLPQFYKTRDWVYNKSYAFIGNAFGQMPLLTDTYAAWYAMNSAQLQNQFNILTSTKNYVAQSGSISSGIAATNSAKSAQNAETENWKARTGLYGGLTGVSGAYIDAAQSGGGLQGAAQLISRYLQLPGSMSNHLSNAANAIATSETGQQIGATAQSLRNTAFQSAINADYSAKMASLESGLAKVRENYDNITAQLSIQGLQAKITDAQTMSPSVRGMGNSNITAALQAKGIALMTYCISDEFAQRIDRYFSVYGYKVNQFEAIYTKTRENWNYIKTVGANITNNLPDTKLPHEARITIRNIYDNGITFWHKGLSNVFNYDTFANPEV